MVDFNARDLLRKAFGCFSAKHRRGFPHLAGLTMCFRYLPIGNAKATFAIEKHLGWNNIDIDVEMARHYAKLKAFIVFPPLAMTPNEFAKSTIRGQLAPLSRSNP